MNQKYQLEPLTSLQYQSVSSLEDWCANLDFLSCAEVGTLRMARDLRPHKSQFLWLFGC